MDKKIIEEKLSYNLDWAYGVEISKMEKYLKDLKELGATHIEIEASVYRGESTLEIDAIIKRKETEEELKKRIENDKIYEARKEDRERREFEKLKKKFGDQK